MRAEKPAQVAGFISEWWPASNRYGGRDQVGIGGRIESEIAADSRGCSIHCCFGTSWPSSDDGTNCPSSANQRGDTSSHCHGSRVSGVDHITSSVRTGQIAGRIKKVVISAPLCIRMFSGHLSARASITVTTMNRAKAAAMASHRLRSVIRAPRTGSPRGRPPSAHGRCAPQKLQLSHSTACAMTCRQSTPRKPIRYFDFARSLSVIRGKHGGSNALI